jgi:hypothetical protein
VLGDGNDIGAGDFGNSNTAICLVCCVEVDMVRSDTCCDGDLELLGLCKTLGGEVAGVESADDMSEEGIS